MKFNKSYNGPSTLSSRSKRSLLAILMTTIIALGCEDQINPELDDAPALVVVDAWLDNESAPQTIWVTSTQPYFENAVPPPISGALVTVQDSEGGFYPFTEQSDGSYQWIPAADQRLGRIGLDYLLTIEIGGTTYTSVSTMNRVPQIDSITFRFEEENLFLDDSYWAEFWSRDPLGPGDTYWIKSYKNGQLLNNPDEINIAFDAGFTEGGNIDGLIFIPPIRDAINPLDEDEDDNFLSPFEDGDSVRVEIYSITNEAFRFLNETALQTNRPGGFAELFATPLSNVPTNITSSDPEETVVGFFNVSAVSRSSSTLDVSRVPREN